MRQSIKITNLLVALFATTLFSAVTIAAVPQTMLIKAEPVNQTQLLVTAHNDLKLSLDTIKININAQVINSKLTKQKQVANKNKSLTLAKTSLLAD